MWQIEPLSQHAVVFPTLSQLAARYQINCLVTGAGAVGCKKLHWFDVPQCVTCKPTTSILSLLQHDKLQLTCIFVCQPSCLELTSWKCAGVNTYGHLQATLQDIFILADDTLSTLETIQLYSLILILILINLREVFIQQRCSWRSNPHHIYCKTNPIFSQAPLHHSTMVQPHIKILEN